MSEQLTYEDKKEMILEAYSKSFDLDVAMDLIYTPLTEDERKVMLKDKEFTTRVRLIDSRLKEELVDRLRDISKSSLQDGVRLSATRDLGKMFYKNRFSDIDNGAGREPLRVFVEFVGSGKVQQSA